MHPSLLGEGWVNSNTIHCDTDDNDRSELAQRIVDHRPVENAANE